MRGVLDGVHLGLETWCVVVEHYEVALPSLDSIHILLHIILNLTTLCVNLLSEVIPDELPLTEALPQKSIQIHHLLADYFACILLRVILMGSAFASLLCSTLTSRCSCLCRNKLADELRNLVLDIRPSFGEVDQRSLVAELAVQFLLLLTQICIIGFSLLLLR